MCELCGMAYSFFFNGQFHKANCPGMKTHRVNGDEMDPMTECGLALPGGITLAFYNETPSCEKCLLEVEVIQL